MDIWNLVVAVLFLEFQVLILDVVFLNLQMEIVDKMNVSVHDWGEFFADCGGELIDDGAVAFVDGGKFVDGGLAAFNCGDFNSKLGAAALVDGGKLVDDGAAALVGGGKFVDGGVVAFNRDEFNGKLGVAGNLGGGFFIFPGLVERQVPRPAFEHVKTKVLLGGMVKNHFRRKR
jgi:hypothetical protein